MIARIYKRTATAGRVTWSYTIEAGSDADGKRQRPSAHGFRTKSEANDAAQKRIDEIKEARRKASDAPPATLRELLDRWFEQSAAKRCTPKTIERYRDLVSYVAPKVLDTALGDLIPMILETEMHRLHESGGRGRVKGLAAKTIRNLFSVLNAALTRALGWGLLTSDPTRGVQLPVVRSREAASLSPDETQRLLEFARGHWFYPILEFAAATACRRGEILALTWSDIEFESKVAAITKSLEQTRAGLRIKAPKSNRMRAVPLPSSLIAVLRDHRRQQEEQRQLFGPDYRADLDLVFADADGNYLRPDPLSAAVSKIATRAGFTHVGLHSLRHSHGSHLLSAGVPLPAVSKRLGHSNPAITLKVYSHALQKDEVQAADTWDALMKPVREASKSVQ